MSTKHKREENLPKDRMKLAMIGSLIIVLIIIGIGFTSFFVGKNEGAKQQSPIPVIDLSKISRGINQRVLGVKTYNWSGEISQLQLIESKIIFTTQVKNENNILETKEISAIIAPHTQLVKWDLTKPPTPDQPDSNKELISPDQLKRGQQIVVKANDNLNSNNEVEASSISLLITPTTQ